MTFPVNLIRQELLALEAYDNGQAAAPVMLNANESPYRPFGAIAEICPVNRYSDPQPLVLRERMASLYGVTPSQILLTRGGDESLDMLVRLFCRAGEDEILVCPPTFVMYEIYATIQGAKVLRVPLTKGDFQLDVAGILAASTDNTKIIFIPSPQAPMGHMMRREDILTLCRAREGKSIILLDEAYVEFTATNGMVQDLKDNDNLVILRTLSKLYALAGERVGCLVGHTELVRNLRRIIPPYPITQSSLSAAMDAISPNGLMQARARLAEMEVERERMIRLLPKSDCVKRVFPSVTNFLFVETTDVAAFLEKLEKFGVRARNRNADKPNAVRLTIGAPKENDAVLAALGITPDPRGVSTARIASVQRNTKETQITATVNLDETGQVHVDTGLGFFDHMLCQIAQHGGFSLELVGTGDLNVDPHHLIEDCALVLGEVIRKALGDKRGIGRFGFTAPLDEAVSEVVLDLSGRPYLSFEGALPVDKVGDMPSDMVAHFYRSLSTSLCAAIHIQMKGENAHHMVEASFKALGRSLRMAVRRDGVELPSTKGAL